MIHETPQRGRQVKFPSLKMVAIVLVVVAATIFLGGYLYLRFYLEGPQNEQSIAGDLKPTKTLKVRNRVGLLRVVAGEDDGISYQGTKIIRLSPVQSVQAALDSIEIRVEQTEDAAAIIVTYKARAAIERKIDLEIRVPPKTNLELEGKSANIWVEGISGNVRILAGDSPNITATDNMGAVRIEAGRSETHLLIPEGAGAAMIRQVSGFVRVVMAGQKPGDLQVQMDEGRVTLTIEPDSQVHISVTTEGIILDTARPEVGTTRGKGRPMVLRTGDGPGMISLSLGRGNLTLEEAKPVFVRSR